MREHDLERHEERGEAGGAEQQAAGAAARRALEDRPARSFAATSAAPAESVPASAKYSVAASTRGVKARSRKSQASA